MTCTVVVDVASLGVHERFAVYRPQRTRTEKAESGEREEKKVQLCLLGRNPRVGRLESASHRVLVVSRHASFCSRGLAAAGRSRFRRSNSPLRAWSPPASTAASPLPFRVVRVSSVLELEEVIKRGLVVLL